MWQLYIYKKKKPIVLMKQSSHESTAILPLAESHMTVSQAPGPESDLLILQAILRCALSRANSQGNYCPFSLIAHLTVVTHMTVLTYLTSLVAISPLQQQLDFCFSAFFLELFSTSFAVLLSLVF